jgi:hypothetical protein
MKSYAGSAKALVRAACGSIAVGVTLGVGAAAPVNTPVTVAIAPEKTDIVEGQGLGVAFNVCNAGDAAVCVCTWPGLAVSFGWEELDGSRSAVGRGYPDSQALGPESFVSLGPGKCFAGRVVVNDLFSPPKQVVTLRAEFRSDQSGSQHGYNCWHGTIDAEGVEVVVRKNAEKHEP